MVKIIFIRGAPAVGKTTITKRLLKELKVNCNLNCAYICEDDFRKQMQSKYKANDLIVHKNSVELIKIVILKLLEMDKYDLIFVEGQFRYREVLDKYAEFISKHDFESVLFQLDLNLNEMKKRDADFRDTKSEDMEDVKKDIDSYTPDNTVFINTEKPIDATLKDMSHRIINSWIYENINKLFNVLYFLW